MSHITACPGGLTPFWYIAIFHTLGKLLYKSIHNNDSTLKQCLTFYSGKDVPHISEMIEFLQVSRASIPFEDKIHYRELLSIIEIGI